MKTLTSLIAILAAVGCAAAQAQGEDYSKVVVEAQKLAEGVYMVTGAGGNIGASVGEDGIALIDDQFAPLTPKIQEALAKLSNKPIRFVINTHWHGDHTGGNENFGKAGAVIVAHENVRKRMSEKQFSQFFNRESPPSPKEALPVVTFTQDVTLNFNGETLQVFHVDNAHTDGDALIYFRNANVLHMGDTFFNRMYPFIDAGSGGGIDGAIAAVDKVLGMVGAETKIIPGHGPLGTRPDLENYRAMLATLRERVTRLIRDGKTLEQVLAEKPIADLDATWGKGFFKPEQIVQMVYLDLKRTVK
jgi:cyclase